MLSAMGEMYVTMIKMNLRKIEDIPRQYQQQVADELGLEWPPDQEEEESNEPEPVEPPDEQETEDE